MNLEVFEGDIASLEVDAVANAANDHLWMGAGVAGALKRAGGDEIEREAIAHAAGGAFLHVSLDLDVVDPDYAPGVGTPVRGGLSYREAHLAMETVAESAHIDSMDVVEVNPILDRENATGELAVELIASALGARIL